MKEWQKQGVEFGDKYQEDFIPLAVGDNEFWYGDFYNWDRIAYKNDLHNLELVWRVHEIAPKRKELVFYVRIFVHIKITTKMVFWEKTKESQAVILLKDIPENRVQLYEYYCGVVENLLNELACKFDKEKELKKQAEKEKLDLLLDVAEQQLLQ